MYIYIYVYIMMYIHIIHVKQSSIYGYAYIDTRYMFTNRMQPNKRRLQSPQNRMQWMTNDLFSQTECNHKPLTSQKTQTASNHVMYE